MYYFFIASFGTLNFIGLTFWHFVGFQGFSANQRSNNRTYNRLVFQLAFHFSASQTYLDFDWSSRRENLQKKLSTVYKRNFVKNGILSCNFFDVKQTLWKLLAKQKMKFVVLDCVFYPFNWQFLLWRLSINSFLFSSSFLRCPRSRSSGRESNALKRKDTWRHTRELRKYFTIFTVLTQVSP